MRIMEFEDSLKAWEGLNEYWLLNEETILKENGACTGSMLIGYANYVFVNNLWLDPEFDFGWIFGYRIQKWSSLLNNYVDLNKLEILRANVGLRIKNKQDNYNESITFDNFHGSGKACLLSLTCSKRAHLDRPVISFVLRASEMTKRLIFDFLLVQRMAEFVYGTEQKLAMEMYVGNMYQNGEYFSVYHNHKNVYKLLDSQKKLSPWASKTKKIIDKLLSVSPDDLNFRAHKRSAAQLQRVAGTYNDNHYRPLKAKDLIIPYHRIEYPADCITRTEKNNYKKKHGL